MIGRAGTGVDNVDVEAATSAGSSSPTPPRRTRSPRRSTRWRCAGLCRNVPQAHASLVAGSGRARFGGTELYGKTLGVLGFGRIGPARRQSAQGFDMQVVAYDKFVTAERFRELGVDGVDRPRSSTRARTSSACTCRRRPRRSTRRRGGDLPDARGGPDRQLRPGRADRPRRARSTGSSPARSPAPPSTSSPRSPSTTRSFARDDVVVTPHLGASTAEAQDRAGVVTAEQVTAALTGGVVTTAVNIAAVRPR